MILSVRSPEPCRQRNGFTITELLVAMSLIIFMMAIFAEAFHVGTDTFHQLKGLGDLQEKLRGATTLLRRDLRADHFDEARGNRLSDQDLTVQGPPSHGFFRIWQGSAPVFEGTDQDGLPSYRATDQFLHFTIKLRGNRPDDFLTASVPTGSLLQGLGLPDLRAPGTYRAQWAEVAYFLRANGTTAEGTPLYSLYRRQLLAVLSPDDLLLNVTNPISSTLWPLYYELSSKPDPTTLLWLFFNTPDQLTIPQRRFGTLPDPTGALAGGVPVLGPPWNYPRLGDRGESPLVIGDDLVLSDVISFEVRILMDGATDFIDVPFPSNNPVFNNLGAHVFDTWSQAVSPPYDYSTWNTAGSDKSIPLRIRVRALQITIRIWDLKTERTRQVTVVQDM